MVKIEFDTNFFLLLLFQSKVWISVFFSTFNSWSKFLVHQILSYLSNLFILHFSLRYEYRPENIFVHINCKWPDFWFFCLSTLSRNNYILMVNIVSKAKREQPVRADWIFSNTIFWMKCLQVVVNFWKLYPNHFICLINDQW